MKDEDLCAFTDEIVATFIDKFPGAYPQDLCAIYMLGLIKLSLHLDHTHEQFSFICDEFKQTYQTALFMKESKDG